MWKTPGRATEGNRGGRIFVGENYDFTNNELHAGIPKIILGGFWTLGFVQSVSKIIIPTKP